MYLILLDYSIYWTFTLFEADCVWKIYLFGYSVIVYTMIDYCCELCWLILTMNQWWRNASSLTMAHLLWENWYYRRNDCVLLLMTSIRYCWAAGIEGGGDWPYWPTGYSTPMTGLILTVLTVAMTIIDDVYYGTSVVMTKPVTTGIID